MGDGNRLFRVYCDSRTAEAAALKGKSISGRDDCGPGGGESQFPQSDIVSCDFHTSFNDCGRIVAVPGKGDLILRNVKIPLISAGEQIHGCSAGKTFQSFPGRFPAESVVPVIAFP